MHASTVKSIIRKQAHTHTKDQTHNDSAATVYGTGSDRHVEWNGSYLQCGPSSGLWAGCPSPMDPQFDSIATVFFDDFMYQSPVDANLRWLEVDDGGTGTNVLQDAANGVASIVTAAADNDYHAIRSLQQTWLFAAGKKLWFEARFKLAEATTNESAWWLGFTDTLTTGGLQANALGPLGTYDGALIWKDEATMAIDFETSNASTQATGTALATVVTDTWTTVGFYFDGVATTSTITPYIDGTAGTAQNITLSGLAEMHMILGVKAGPTAAAETLQVDYVKAIQLR